jgi:hypothetical protein
MVAALVPGEATSTVAAVVPSEATSMVAALVPSEATSMVAALVPGEATLLLCQRWWGWLTGRKEEGGPSNDNKLGPTRIESEIESGLDSKTGERLNSNLAWDSHKIQVGISILT